MALMDAVIADLAHVACDAAAQTTGDALVAGATISQPRENSSGPLGGLERAMSAKDALDDELHGSDSTETPGGGSSAIVPDDATTIASLPWELISKILLFLEPSTAYTFKLSRVSRMFRDVILHEPKLWEVVDFYVSQATDNAQVDKVDDWLIAQVFGDGRVARAVSRKVVLDYSSVITAKSVHLLLDLALSLKDLSVHGCIGIRFSEDEVRHLYADYTLFGTESYFVSSERYAEPQNGGGPKLEKLSLIGVTIYSDAFEGPLSLSRLCGRICALPTFFSNPFRTASLPPYLGFPMCERCTTDRRLVLTFAHEQTVCGVCQTYQHLCVNHLNKSRCLTCRKRLFCSWCETDDRYWDGGIGGSTVRCEDCLQSWPSRPSTLSGLLDSLGTARSANAL